MWRAGDGLDAVAWAGSGNVSVPGIVFPLLGMYVVIGQTSRTDTLKKYGTRCGAVSSLHEHERCEVNSALNISTAQNVVCKLCLIIWMAFREHEWQSQRLDSVNVEQL